MKNLLISVSDYSNYYQAYSTLFSNVSHDINRLFEEPESVGLVAFTGGSDVYPGLYRDIPNNFTCYNKSRDDKEVKIAKFCIEHGIPMAGICRGFQFINVMAGGKVVQHVTKHAGVFHTVETIDGESFGTNSTHHQMVLPPDSAVKLAWAVPMLSDMYVGGSGLLSKPEFEVESAYFPNIKAVGCQWHPEMLLDMPAFDRAISFLTEKISKYLLTDNTVEKVICQGQ